jgi:hypothetical protein
MRNKLAGSRVKPVPDRPSHLLTDISGRLHLSFQSFVLIFRSLRPEPSGLNARSVTGPVNPASASVRADRPSRVGCVRGLCVMDPVSEAFAIVGTVIMLAAGLFAVGFVILTH